MTNILRQLNCNNNCAYNGVRIYKHVHFVRHPAPICACVVLKFKCKKKTLPSLGDFGFNSILPWSNFVTLKL